MRTITGLLVFFAIAVNAQEPAGKPGHRVAVFLAEGFPTADAPPVKTATLKGALREFDAAYLSVDSLTTGLTIERFRTLVLPYGSAFPVEGWAAIHSFISRGGSLVVLGGYPFHQPVLKDHGHWVLGTPQPTFAHQLLIGPADEISLDSSPFYHNNVRLISPEESDFDAAGFRFPSRVYELTVRLTTLNDSREEIGSAGPRDGVVRPLVQIVNGDGVPVACPLLEIDRLRGGDAGGRWILEPSDATLNSSTIRYCVERAMEGASAIEAIPVHACVDDGEFPMIRISRSRPKPDEMDEKSSACSIVVTDSARDTVFTSNVRLSGTREFQSGEIPVRSGKNLGPGFYNVRVRNEGAGWRPNSCSTGFWIMDRKLLNSGPHLSASKDWLLKNGKVFPVIGTSYMAANAGRKYLLEPNPFLWEKDFSQMEKQGVNFVRTGLWAGWQKVMPDPGAIDDAFLRSLDALLLTAARHRIVVCFNLFAFLPPANGGTNPYLDPRALEWQNSFAALIASRYKGVGWIHYDLINEPSYAPQDKIWQEVPIGDAYERDHWGKWVSGHHADNPTEAADDWRDASGDRLALPGEEDLSYEQIRGERHPRKGVDFQLFAQDVLTDWAGNLRDLIHSAGGDPLVTLGQDEGGMSRRSSQQFHAPSVDYTSIHTWWLNDHLLWDVVATKVPEKPNLVSETGLMRLETIDGEPWRSPVAAAQLLERKFAYAFQGRGAGVVEWCWNVNAYQSTDNEVGIGLTRADGTMKIETEVFREFADFFASAQPSLGDYQQPTVILVIPDSKLFSGAQGAMDGVKRIVRVLAEDFGVVPEMLSEYKLSAERLESARLILVPDPEMMCDSAASALYRASQRGTKVLFTGALQGNEYGKLSPGIRQLGLMPGGLPVSYLEPTNWSFDGHMTKRIVTFGAGKSEYLLKGIAPSRDSLRGNILIEPLPLELADEKEPLIALLRSALEYSGIPLRRYDTPAASVVLETGSSALVVCVNESSSDLEREVIVGGTKYDIPVAAGRARLVLFSHEDNRVIAATKGEPARKAE